ncbi:Threonine dehydratase biosynthetic [Fasciola gigantica]|uniref:L-serine ammonia-lyase n=1 Tax=Fasciola gigantica TaxID=46835 RepID=A0A504Z1U9_FASGI|nr:Threonine dehydratase biosynthetic [Fasciola gigantica]
MWFVQILLRLQWASCGVTHVVCPSGGNAAIAAACSARAYGISCTIVMPETADACMRRRLLLETPDAKVIVHGSDWLEAHQRAEQMVNELQMTHPGESIRLLHPYDQSELWEGYEGIIDELGPDLGQPDVIIVSVGGGGLLAGIIQGLWNRGWSSTHVVAVETEGADCLNRSIKAGQLLLLPRPTSIATSLSAPILAHRTWNLAQLQSLTPVTCTDSDAIDAVRQFLDDHGMLVEPACGASLSTLYSGMIGRLQMEGRIPRPANVVVVIGGGRNVSLRQLSEWENQTNSFGSLHQLSTSFLPSMTSPYLANTSPHSVSSDMSTKSNLFAPHLSTDPDETLKCGTSTPSTPRPVCTVLSRPPMATEGIDSHAPSGEVDRETNAEGSGTLNPHDLVNFSKLLATSETEGDDGGLHE